MIQVEEALREILAHITVLGTERVALSDGLGRVLAEDVSATLNVPPCDNSAMDGYALRYADIEGASQSSPARLKVIGDLPAGYSFDASVGQGEALRIMTGAPVP
ncbi:MAG: molybdopterin molybdenumtransferase MoeA, partial [Deltaproteobacteria bacterium]|nr:molybdopterin molybdenumtransferase MoeA [Deltaproteobacteria bacterium]